VGSSHMEPGDYVVMPVVQGRAVWPVVSRDGLVCECDDLVSFHALPKQGPKVRGACSRSGCGCTKFTPKSAPEKPTCPTCGQEVPG